MGAVLWVCHGSSLSLKSCSKPQTPSLDSGGFLWPHPSFLLQALQQKPEAEKGGGTMKLDKPNMMNSSGVFRSEPFKENRVVQELRPLVQHPENPRSSAPQPIFTLGRRSRGKALEI